MDTSDKEWCSAEGLQSRPYIQLNFTEPVVLTRMRARGGDGGLSYVTAFSILSEKGGAGLEQYEQPNGVTAVSSASQYVIVLCMSGWIHPHTEVCCCGS